MRIAAITPSLRIPDLATYASGSEDRIALIDSEGNIVGANDKWLTAYRLDAETHRAQPGAHYLDMCRWASFSSADAREALNGIRAVLEGKLPFFTMDYSGDSPAEVRHFRIAVTPIRYEAARFALIHSNITELHLSKEKGLKRIEGFARRLIHAQEEERERIARELHDDLGNRIALLSFSVRRILNRRADGSAPQLGELNQIIDHITDLSNALRNLSHCLHPPLLKHAGICAALKTLCAEFEGTHGVQMHVVVPQHLSDLPDAVTLCIFRVSQECLHNIAKHAGACSVSVVLQRTPRELRLKVSDTGPGFDPEKATEAGLGLVSMKERVLHVRGRLDIQSAPGAGTQICVTIPLPQKKSKSHSRGFCRDDSLTAKHAR